MFLRYHTTPGRYTPGMLLFLMDRDRLSRLAAVAGRVRLLVVAPSVPTHRTISTNVYLVMVLVTKEERDPLKIQVSKKIAKLVPWSHVFVCLADTDADRVPSDYSLLSANGRSSLLFMKKAISWKFIALLLKRYQNLSMQVDMTCYELMKTVSNSR